MPNRDSESARQTHDGSTKMVSLLHDAHGHIDEIDRQLGAQVEGTVLIQEQLDELRLTLKSLAAMVSLGPKPQSVTCANVAPRQHALGLVKRKTRNDRRD